jgi:hypothetical protein
MERDREGELNSRQEKRRHIHCNSPGSSPSKQPDAPLLWKSTVEHKGNYLKVAMGQASTIKFAVRL